EPEAICYEHTTGAFKSEYRRRVRIVSRSWRAVFQARGVLNPFRVGLFSWCLISHKILRWNTGLFAAIGAAAALALIVNSTMSWPVPAFAATAAAVALATLTPGGRRAVSMAFYFAVINLASFVGVLKGSIGKVSGIWSTPRAHAAAPAGLLIAVGPVFLVGGALIAGAMILGANAAGLRITAVAFWGALFALVYVYVLYPIVLSLLRVFARRPIKVDAIEPTVCLFIAANDE